MTSTGLSTNKPIIKALNISNVVISNVVVANKLRNKKAPIHYNDGKLVFQTPYLTANSILVQTSTPNIYQFDTVFKGKSKKRCKELFEFIDTLESDIANKIIRNGMNWFTTSDISIKSLIRQNNDETFFIRWLLDLSSCVFIDDSKNQINPHESLDVKDLVRFIVEVKGAFVQDNKIGLAVIVHKIRVKKPEPKDKVVPEYDFDSESESDNSEEKRFVPVLETEKAPHSKNTRIIQTNQSREYDLDYNQLKNQKQTTLKNTLESGSKNNSNNTKQIFQQDDIFSDDDNAEQLVAKISPRPERSNKSKHKIADNFGYGGFFE